MKEFVQIKMEAELKKELQKRAKELNMTVTAYLIYLFQKDIGKL